MITLRFDNDLGEADCVQADDGGVAEGDELETAVVISLFTDRRVTAEEAPAGGERGGWWGDAYAEEEGDEIGSRIWLLLERGRDLPETPVRLRAYALEALEWLVSDGVASSVAATVRRLQPGALLLELVILPTAGAERRFSFEV